jgi:hypothetical protein
MIAAVPTRAGLYRFVRGYFVGVGAASPDLWGFCGDADRRVMADLPVLLSAAPGCPIPSAPQAGPSASPHEKRWSRRGRGGVLGWMPILGSCGRLRDVAGHERAA